MSSTADSSDEDTSSSSASSSNDNSSKNESDSSASSSDSDNDDAEENPDWVAYDKAISDQQDLINQTVMAVINNPTDLELRKQVSEQFVLLESLLSVSRKDYQVPQAVQALLDEHKANTLLPPIPKPTPKKQEDLSQTPNRKLIKLTKQAKQAPKPAPKKVMKKAAANNNKNKDDSSSSGSSSSGDESDNQTKDNPKPVAKEPEKVYKTRVTVNREPVGCTISAHAVELPPIDPKPLPQHTTPPKNETPPSARSNHSAGSRSHSHRSHTSEPPTAPPPDDELAAPPTPLPQNSVAVAADPTPEVAPPPSLQSPPSPTLAASPPPQQVQQPSSSGGGYPFIIAGPGGQPQQMVGGYPGQPLSLSYTTPTFVMMPSMSSAVNSSTEEKEKEWQKDKLELEKQLEALQKELAQKETDYNREKELHENLQLAHKKEKTDWELSLKELESTLQKERAHWEKDRKEERLSWMKEHDEERKMWRQSLDQDRQETQKQRELWLAECRAREAECEKFATERRQWESERKSWKEVYNLLDDEREAWRKERQGYIRQLQDNEVMLQQANMVLNTKFHLPGEIVQNV